MDLSGYYFNYHPLADLIFLKSDQDENSQTDEGEGNILSL
jgi:hypothetical protein